MTILIAFFSICSDADEVYTTTQLNCFMRFLKSEQKLDSDYPEFNVTRQYSDCESFVKDDMRETLKMMAFELRMESNSGLLLAYLIRDLKLGNLVENFWLTLIYSASDTMSKDDKEKKIEVLKSKSRIVTEIAAKECSYEHIFGAYFNTMVNERQNQILNEPLANYCARKEIIKNKLLNPSYNLSANSNIDNSNVDCDAVLKPISDKFNNQIISMSRDESHDLTNENIQCFNQKSSEENFVLKNIAVLLLNELNLSNEHKVTERQKYINFMSHVMETAENCL